MAKALASALGVSIDELAGQDEQRLKITGNWWAAWQTSKDGEELRTCQTIEIRQRGTELDIAAIDRGISVEEGGYLWRGQTPAVGQRSADGLVRR